MKKIPVLTAFLRWITGLPPLKPKSVVRTWLERALLALAVLFIAWLFLVGPGVVLMPYAPVGFSTLSDGTNTVLYTAGERENAAIVLRVAGQAQSDILDFWDDRATNPFAGGVKIYLCYTEREYFHLTRNRAGGSAMLGSIIIDMSKVGVNFSLSGFVRHEMAHVYMAKSAGWLPMVLGVPKWLDDGVATLIQGEPSDMSRLGGFLAARPFLVSVASMMRPWDWEAVVSFRGGSLGRQEYGYVGHFVRDLINRHGMAKLREYRRELSPFRDSEVLFKSIFEVPLEQAEADWLASEKRGGLVPENVELVSLTYPFPVLAKWWGGLGVFVFLFLWVTRQCFRLIRSLRARIFPQQAQPQAEA